MAQAPPRRIRGTTTRLAALLAGAAALGTTLATAALAVTAPARAIAATASGGPPPVHARARAAAPPRVAARAALERAFEAALAAQEFEVASALADSLVRVRERAEPLAPPRAAALCDSLGLRLFSAGTPEAMAAAEPLFRAGLARREAALGPGDPAVANSLVTLATVLDYLGRWREAVPLAERAVAIRARALGERDPQTAAALRQLGLLHFQLGALDSAAVPLERALAIYDGAGERFAARLADAHNNLGELARVRDQLDIAESHFRRGLAVAEARLAEDDPIRLALANNLAGLFKDVGRLGEAEPLLERGLALLERPGGDPDALATARLNLAEVRRLQGHAATAEPLYLQALAQARVTLGAANPGLITFLNQAAVCEQELGHFARADSLYRETGAIVEATLGPDHLLMAQHLGDRARLAMQSGDSLGADTLLARAIVLRERALGPAHPDVALLLIEQARSRAARAPDDAAARLDRALAILDSTSAYPDARLDAHAARAEGHAAHGRLDAAIADMAVALATMDSLRAWRGGGDETRAAFVAGRLDLVDRMVDWQLARGAVAAALSTHEHARARGLLDQIVASGVDLRAGIPPDVLGPLATDERAAEARLAAAHRALEDTRLDPALGARERLEALAGLAARRDSAALELGRARRRIEDASPVWRGVLSAEGRIPDAARLQREVVPRDGLLLVYHVGRAASHVFVVPPRGPVTALALALDPDAAAALGVAPGPLTDSTLERIVTGDPARDGPTVPLGIAPLLGGTAAGGFVTLPLRASAGPDSFEVRLHALWRTLVPAPLRAPLHAARTALVVPDGALHLVAFEALVARTRARGAPTRYWLDDGPAISYGPSATSLWSLARRPARALAGAGERAEVLSVSDVAYAPPPAPDAATAAPRLRAWSPLPGTALETAAIRAAFGAGRVDVLSGAAAREPAVRAALPGHRYLHLATHGFADRSGDRLAAGLVLAPPPAPGADSDDDGLLELFEIHRLALDCRLAVLSACETAKGPRLAGEGAFALSRGFLAAGARQVVASLWAVDDRPTAAVMGGLFAGIAAAEARAKPPDLARALRDAKRRVRQDPRWADPFYWAPFVLSGR